MNDLPACLGYYGNPVDGHACSTCEARELCKGVIAKKRLEPVFERLRKIEAIIKG